MQTIFNITDETRKRIIRLKATLDLTDSEVVNRALKVYEESMEHANTEACRCSDPPGYYTCWSCPRARAGLPYATNACSIIEV
jgi:hypothetical protein